MPGGPFTNDQSEIQLKCLEEHLENPLHRMLKMSRANAKELDICLEYKLRKRN